MKESLNLELASEAISGCGVGIDGERSESWVGVVPPRKVRGDGSGVTALTGEIVSKLGMERGGSGGSGVLSRWKLRGVGEGGVTITGGAGGVRVSSVP